MKQFLKKSMILCMLVVIFVGCNQIGISDSKNNSTDEEEQAIDLPYDWEGKIRIEAVFQFSGMNPDADLKEGEEIASLTVTNISEEHFKTVEIRIMTGNGSKLQFEITDLPAGKQITVFEKNNKVFEMSDVCISVNVKTTKAENTSLQSMVDISVEELTVTVTNKTNKDLKNLVVHCHCMLDDTFFGGLTYNYPIEIIEAGESLSVEAFDCYLGQAEVVWVSEGNVGNE